MVAVTSMKSLDIQSKQLVLMFLKIQTLERPVQIQIYIAGCKASNLIW